MNTASRNITKLLLCFMLILPWTTMPAPSFSHDRQNSPKAKITALYLYNFLLFVDWPENAGCDSDTLKVCIFGAPALYEALKSMEGQRIGGKKLAIFSLTTPEDLDESCQVLFAGEKEKPALKELLEKVKGRRILTVSDNTEFISLGGMVSFKDPDTFEKSDGKAKRFIINLSAAQKSGLKIRSRLLRMSDIVYDLAPGNLKVP